MSFGRRFKPAFKAFCWHLAGSVLVAGAAAVVVFKLWYAGPYAAILGGLQLFLLVVTVDIVTGPLLTLVLFDPRKSKRELSFDLGLVAVLQLAALVYGMSTVWQARPVYLIFEVDRFRVITYADIDPKRWAQKPPEIEPPGWLGPKTISVRVAQPGDADYLNQVELAVSGLDAAFQPDRWLPYENAKTLAAENARPLAGLVSKHPAAETHIEQIINTTGNTADELLWVPVQSRKLSNWVALLDAKTLGVVAFLPFDGF